MVVRIRSQFRWLLESGLKYDYVFCFFFHLEYLGFVYIFVNVKMNYY